MRRISQSFYAGIDGVSKFRILLLRLFYFILFLFLGIDAWMKIVSHPVDWDPLHAVAFSFWGALSGLAIVGIFRPLFMIPLLLIQLFYKLIWLMMVFLTHNSEKYLSDNKELIYIFIVGLFLDILLIPWKFVVRKIFSKDH